MTSKEQILVKKVYELIDCINPYYIHANIPDKFKEKVKIQFVDASNSDGITIAVINNGETIRALVTIYKKHYRYSKVLTKTVLNKLVRDLMLRLTYIWHIYEYGCCSAYFTVIHPNMEQLQEEMKPIYDTNITKTVIDTIYHEINKPNKNNVS